MSGRGGRVVVEVVNTKTGAHRVVVKVVNRIPSYGEQNASCDF